MKDDITELTRKTIHARQRIAKVIVGLETEPVYSAMLELLSEILMEAQSPMYALGNTVVVLANYLQLKSGCHVTSVEVEQGGGDDPEHDQSLN